MPTAAILIADLGTGDGFSNLQEANAGTNPFDSNSYPHIPIMSCVP